MDTEFLALAGMMVAGFAAFLAVKHFLLRLVKKKDYEDEKSKISFEGLAPLITKITFLYVLEWYFLFIMKTSIETIMLATIILAPVNAFLAYFIEVSYVSLTR